MSNYLPFFAISVRASRSRRKWLLTVPLSLVSMDRRYEAGKCSRKRKLRQVAILTSFCLITACGNDKGNSTSSDQLGSPISATELSGVLWKYNNIGRCMNNASSLFFVGHRLAAGVREIVDQYAPSFASMSPEGRDALAQQLSQRQNELASGYSDDIQTLNRNANKACASLAEDFKGISPRMAEFPRVKDAVDKCVVIAEHIVSVTDRSEGFSDVEDFDSCPKDLANAARQAGVIVPDTVASASASNGEAVSPSNHSSENSSSFPNDRRTATVDFAKTTAAYVAPVSNWGLGEQDGDEVADFGPPESESTVTLRCDVAKRAILLVSWGTAPSNGKAVKIDAGGLDAVHGIAIFNTEDEGSATVVTPANSTLYSDLIRGKTPMRVTWQKGAVDEMPNEPKLQQFLAKCRNKTGV